MKILKDFIRSITGQEDEPISDLAIGVIAFILAVLIMVLYTQL